MEHNKTMHVKFTTDQLANLKAVANQLGMPVSTYVRIKALEAARADQ